MRCVVLSALCLLAAAVLPARASDAFTLNADRCVANDARPAHERIAACTFMIGRSATDGRIDRAEAFFRRSYAYDAEHEYDRAIDDLTAALRLKPRNTAYLNNRAFTYRLKGDLDHRLADYETAFAIDPKFHTVATDLADALIERGVRSERAGQPDAAIGDYDRVLSMSPRHYAALNDRGFALIDKQDYQAAVASLTQAIRVAPGRFEAYESLGQAWAAAGDPDRAIEAFTRSLAINPTKALTYQRRGDAFRRKGDLASALADYRRALGLDPRLAPAATARDEVEASLAPKPAAAPPLRTSPDPASPPGGQTQGPAATQAQAAVAGPAAAVQTAVAAAPGSALGTRVALVIGNSAYRTVARLPNPDRDADLVADALRKAGFKSVALLKDATHTQFEDALRAFAEEAAAADWAVVYYAGHGIEMNGSNYLVPVDATLATDRSVQFEAVPLDQVLAAADGAKKLKLVMLDACRNDPFQVTMVRSLGTRSVGRGLARVEADAGTIVAFAAGPGQTAEDGEGNDSPFASAIARHVADPDVEVYQFFRIVHDDVVQATGAKQQPYVNATLSADTFYFNPTSAR